MISASIKIYTLTLFSFNYLIFPILVEKKNTKKYLKMYYIYKISNCYKKNIYKN